jgi:hypothetical protein
MLAMTLAVSPRTNSQRKCWRLRSTGSFVLWERPLKFLDGEVRFKLNASCHVFLLQRCDATWYKTGQLQSVIILVLATCCERGKFDDAPQQLAFVESQAEHAVRLALPAPIPASAEPG